MTKELILAAITFSSTLMTGDIPVDIVVGICTYSLARLFWWQFEVPIKKTIERIKKFIKNNFKKEKINKN
jgi:hypothetical protein